MKKRRLIFLIPDWHHVLRRAWSMRLAALAGVLTAAEAILPLFAADLPRGLFSSLSAIAIAGAMIARLVAQKELQRGMWDD